MADGDDEIHLPHDKLFAAAFGVPANATAFLQASIPPNISSAIAWNELKQVPGSFVDTHFKSSHADLLFSAPLAGREGLIYLLFEHQSTPDPALPLRLLRYVMRIWEEFRQQEAGRVQLPVVLPVVLSQNAEVWDIEPRLSAMLDMPRELERDLAPFIPDFEYRHVQLAGMAFESLPGTPTGIMIWRVMKAERLGRLLDDPMWDEPLLSALPPDLLHMVLRYLLGADIERRGFVDKVNKIQNSQTQRVAMTLAQQFRQKGRQDGRQEGRQEDILEALRVRFGQVPEGLEESIRFVGDDARLRELFRCAIRCGSLEEFRSETLTAQSSARPGGDVPQSIRRAAVLCLCFWLCPHLRDRREVVRRCQAADGQAVRGTRAGSRAIQPSESRHKCPSETRG